MCGPLTVYNNTLDSHYQDLTHRLLSIESSCWPKCREGFWHSSAICFCQCCTAPPTCVYFWSLSFRLMLKDNTEFLVQANSTMLRLLRVLKARPVMASRPSWIDFCLLWLWFRAKEGFRAQHTVILWIIKYFNIASNQEHYAIILCGAGFSLVVTALDWHTEKALFFSHHSWK